LDRTLRRLDLGKAIGQQSPCFVAFGPARGAPETTDKEDDGEPSAPCATPTAIANDPVADDVAAASTMISTAAVARFS